jgi:hypothetical protein
MESNQDAEKFRDRLGKRRFQNVTRPSYIFPNSGSGTLFGKTFIDRKIRLAILDKAE